MYCFFMYRKYGIPQRAMDGGADIYMAPRPGLEPGTNGLTVQLTLCFHWCKLKNFMGFSNSNSSFIRNPSLSRKSPMIHWLNCTRTYGFDVLESQSPQGIMADRTMNRTRADSEIGSVQAGVCDVSSPATKNTASSWSDRLRSQHERTLE